MSKKKKKNSKKPPGFVGKSRPMEKQKRILVFLFGLVFVSIDLWAISSESDLSILQWWHFVLMGMVFLLGVYLMLVASIPHQKQLNRMHEELLSTSAYSVLTRILDKLF